MNTGLGNRGGRIAGKLAVGIGDYWAVGVVAAAAVAAALAAVAVVPLEL